MRFKGKNSIGRFEAMAASGQITFEHLTFTSEGHMLEGTLYKPTGDGPFPAIVVLHAASAGEQDNPQYLHLAQVMNEIGVAVFIYDRRDESIPRKERVRGYMALGRDGLAGVRMLKKRDDIDGTHMGLWGISQGGWVAPAAFVQDPDEIAFIILVSSSGVGPAEQMVHAVAQVLRSSGYNQEVTQEAARLREKVHAYYRGEVSRKAAQAHIDQHKGEPWFEHLYISETLPEDVTQTSWYTEMQFEPFPIFSRITVPLLLLYGEDDPWIPVEKSITIWRDALAEAGNDDVEIYRVPRTGHSMLMNETGIVNYYDLGDMEFSPIYTRLMQDFVRRVVAHRSGSDQSLS